MTGAIPQLHGVHADNSALISNIILGTGVSFPRGESAEA